MMRRAEPLSARAIAAEAGINRTTTHRLLNALIHRGWIEKPAGTASYRLRLKFVALAPVGSLGRSFLGEGRPALGPLSRPSRGTGHLRAFDGFEVLPCSKNQRLGRAGICSHI